MFGLAEIKRLYIPSSLSHIFIIRVVVVGRMNGRDGGLSFDVCVTMEDEGEEDEDEEDEEGALFFFFSLPFVGSDGEGGSDHG